MPDEGEDLLLMIKSNLSGNILFKYGSFVNGCWTDFWRNKNVCGEVLSWEKIDFPTDYWKKRTVKIAYSFCCSTESFMVEKYKRDMCLYFEEEEAKEFCLKNPLHFDFITNTCRNFKYD